MSRIESYNKVREYPDKDVTYTTITIRNHWNYRDKVVLKIGSEEREYVFIADDLIMAIKNAQNCHRF